MRTPDFREMPNLEYLDLRRCTSLEEVDDSLGYCGKLIQLDLGGCSSLKRFPCVNLESLDYLNLRSCSSLEKFPEFEENKEEMGTHFPCLRYLDLSESKRLMRTPDFTGMPNLEYLDMSSCMRLEEVHHSLGYCGKLIGLDLRGCRSLKRFPCVNLESLQYLGLRDCSSLEKFPEIKGRGKLGLQIEMVKSGIRELPSSFFQLYTDLTKLDWSFLPNLVALPRSIGMLKSLVELDLSYFSSVEILPEEIGDLENLEKLKACYTLISRPPSSIVRLNKLKYLDFGKEESEVGLQDGVCFEFPQVNEGLHSLEYLDLRYCNLIDGGLPEDIGSLSSLKRLYLMGNNFEHLPQSVAQLGALQSLKLSYCTNLKEFPRVNEGLRSLEHLDLSFCNLINGLPQDIGCLSSLKMLSLDGNNFEHLPRSVAQLGALQYLNLSDCCNLKEFPRVNEGLHSLEYLHLSHCNFIGGGLPEDIGSLSSLKELYLNGNNFEHLPRSIAQIAALRILDISDCRNLKEFPRVNEGLHSLEYLHLSHCNFIDGGLPEDIGSLSSLKELYLIGNNFENLPRSIAQLAALQYLNLSHCYRLTQLPEFPQQLDKVNADWSNDWICNSLFQNISSLQHISASDSSSLRVFIGYGENIPSWFHHRAMDTSVSVNLPENWYVPDNFLGFAVCYFGSLVETTAQLIPFCDDGMSRMTQKLALYNHSQVDIDCNIQFFLVPLSSLWDTSKANGKTPNDYGTIGLTFSGERKKLGLRLLYKDEPELEALLPMRENNDEPTEDRIMTRRSRYDDSEASSSS